MPGIIGSTGADLSRAWIYDRPIGRIPVRYPTACNPQAWASGAPLLLVRTMIGLDTRDHELVLDPNVPEEIGQIKLIGTNAFGKRWNIEAIGARSHVHLA